MRPARANGRRASARSRSRWRSGRQEGTRRLQRCRIARLEQCGGEPPLALHDERQKISGALHGAKRLEAAFQKPLQVGQACQSRRPTHQVQAAAQQGFVHQTVEVCAHLDDERDLALAQQRLTGRLPGSSVGRGIKRRVGQRLTHCAVELFRQCMQAHHRAHDVDDLGRKHPHQRWYDAPELLVTLGKVLRTVHFVEEKPRSAAIALVGEQVGIGVREPPLLIAFDRLDARPQLRRALTPLALRLDGSKLQQNGGSIKMRGHDGRIGAGRREARIMPARLQRVYAGAHPTMRSFGAMPLRQPMDSRVQLVYYGEVIRGFKRSDVRDDLGDLLEIDEASRSALFSGARIVLKSEMDFFEAQGYEERLRELGARVHIEPDDEVDESGAAPAKGAPPPAVVTPEPVPEAPPVATAPALLVMPPPVIEVTCANCGERQPQRVMCRACGSDMAMALAYKQESEAATRLQRLAQARARRGLAPQAGDDAAPDAPSAWGLGFSGRLARLPYIAAMCWVVLTVNLLFIFSIPHPTPFKLYVLILGTLILLVFATRLSILRAHDFNGSGLWALLVWIPYLGAAAALALASLPGTAEDNDHGGRPRSGHLLLSAVAAVLMTLTLVATYRWIATMVEEVLPVGGPAVDVPKDTEVVARMPSADAVAVFRDEYLTGPSNKAFAASPTGSWGWKAGAASPESAAAAALESCDAKRESYSRPCELVSVNGRWVSR